MRKGKEKIVNAHTGSEWGIREMIFVFSSVSAVFIISHPEKEVWQQCRSAAIFTVHLVYAQKRFSF